MKPRFFSTPQAFRRWLVANHAAKAELLAGFYKKASGIPSMTWPESVDQALCFGWIDGVRKRIDDVSYTIRFTPRRPGSIWSAVNIRKAEELIRQGFMQPAGLKAFAARTTQRSQLYSYENAPRSLDRDAEARFEQNAEAWSFFYAQPPSYRRVTIYWVMSARREETRARRLQTLIANSAVQRRLGDDWRKKS